jgi:hypothetical protein
MSRFDQMSAGYAGSQQMPDNRDSANLDERGWKVEPMPEQDTRYIDHMGERGTWDSVLTGFALQKAQQTLDSDAKLVIVGGGDAANQWSNSPVVGLFNVIKDDVRTYRG